MAEGIRRQRITAQSETLQSLIGSPGNPTPNSPLRATGPTGIFTAPPENQAGLIADAFFKSGQISGGITTLQQLVGRREQIAQQESQFQRTTLQNQNQFNARAAADLSEFEDEQILKRAQRREQSAQHLIDITKTKLGIDKTEQDIRFAVANDQRAADAFGRIPTTEQEKFLAMSDTFHEIKDAHRDFQKGYAVNSFSVFGGQEELNQIRRSSDPSVSDMAKLNFWDITVNSMNLFLGQAISGAEIPEATLERIGRLLPTVQDNAAEIDVKLNGWQNFWGKRLDRRMTAWVSQKRTVQPLLDLGLGNFEARPLSFQPGQPEFVPLELLDQATPD